MELYLALAARSGGPVVELAAGTGRIAVPLARAGHRVLAIDRDPAMLARAARRATAAAAPNVPAPATDAAPAGHAAPAAGAAAAGSLADRLAIREADLRSPLPDEADRYRLAILALNSLFVLDERRDQAVALERMAALVGPGGLVVVDVWHPQPIDIVRMDGRVSLEWLRADPETGREVTKLASAWYDPATRVATLVTVFEEGGQGEAPARWTRSDRLRLATADELVEWAERTGLEVERLAGDYELSPFGAASERAVLVARKRA